ncbi:hypothetical protein HUN92_13635 [Bacillus firmus]|uniref:hypothetical protein n=1 Tax=Cytobacillus firmus TaxID=1399 RepID=UPI001580EB32|nr:hypothetical protein [Cytobacillus firmus]NUH84762.1 hypothetical protein [Cytobacillus firmus]
MTFPSKTYKVFPLYRLLYEACIDVVNEQKSHLMKALLKKTIGPEKAEALNCYDFNELIEKMIDDFETELNNTSYDDIKIKVAVHPRMTNIRKHFNKIKKSHVLTNISFRISKSSIEKINNLKQNTLGEVIELAIGLYIINCDEQIYELILLTIQHYDD